MKASVFRPLLRGFSLSVWRGGLLNHAATVLFALLASLFSLPVIAQQDTYGNHEAPPRLSFVEGQVSFSRAGADDWAPARLNTPIAAADAFYTGVGANLEIQIGSRAFARAGEKTQLNLVNHEPDFLQFKVTTGQASFDLRTLPAGYTIELDTPNAIFTIERTGYYRVEVMDDETHFITRRGGQAFVTLASGETQSISPSEEVVVSGIGTATAETYVAPEIDAWDRWNYARTDYYTEAVSSRYLPSSVYGAESLDYYGNWREVPTYGPIWVPDRVPPGWAPYSTGSWIWDPFYGWSWIDDAPWGWAPFHYGRWVAINGFWAWAPGPVTVHPAYAPALVAFFGFGHDVSVRIGMGVPAIGWVSLGWGEPLIPWWGPAGFIGRPWWGGWGGPHIVNNVVEHRPTVINVNNITYQNSKISNAIVAVRSEHFRKGAVSNVRIPVARIGDLSPISGVHPVKPEPASLLAGGGNAVRPPEAVLSRPAVATRRHREVNAPWHSMDLQVKPSAIAPEPRIVKSPKDRPQLELPKVPFAVDSGPERPRPSLPPRFEEMRPVTPSLESRERGIQRKERSEQQRSAPAPVDAIKPLPPKGVQEQREIREKRETREQREIRRSDGIQPAIPREAREPRFGVQVQPQGRSQQETQVLPGKPANRMFPRRGQENP